MKYFKNLIAKHHKTCLIFACISKNVAAAIAIEDMLFSGLVGMISYLSVRKHLFDGHHLLHIKKHHPHQEIPLNPDKKKYTCQKCKRGYDSIIGLMLHKIKG